MRLRAENQIKNENKIQVRLVLIRHGETAANLERRYLGRTDEPLSREGVKKLTCIRSMRQFPPVDLLFTSPMRRCLETAAILYPETPPVTISDWKEMDFGAFERKNYEELKDDERYQAWIDSGGLSPFPEGENREEFTRRCLRGTEEMAGRLRAIRESGGRLPETVAAIVHGGTVMAILSSFYGGDYFDYQVANGEGYVCCLTAKAGGVQLTNLRKI